MKMMLRTLIILLTSSTSLYAASFDDPACSENPDTVTATVKIDASKVLRKNVPPSLFGFDLPWADFQDGHFRNGKVRSETIAWLKPFAGAVYRFTGGNIYEWQKGVGPIEERSKMKNHYSTTGYTFPFFGLGEYAKFLQQVDGNGIVVMNMMGPDGSYSEEPEMVADNIAMLDWFKESSGIGCVAGGSCRIKYWEMGNELDLEEDWTANQYATRAKALASALNEKYPGIRTLASGYSAPWDGPSMADQFNYSVAGEVADSVSGVTMHAYYDGYSVPSMLSWLSRTVTPYRQINSSANMVITEHGRWPSQTHENWADDWYKASGSIGAISTADFIISIAKVSYINVAAWHSLGVSGPWQLFHYSIPTNQVYPSAVYWALRTLREGLLTSRVSVTPEKLITDFSYGYGVNLLAMKNAAGELSLVGINRSPKPLLMTIAVENSDDSVEKTINYNYVIADEAGSDNTDDAREKIVMQTSSVVTSDPLPEKICISPRSVFSVR
jgi:Alpha-L-arabinofuranosidase